MASTPEVVDLSFSDDEKGMYNNNHNNDATTKKMVVGTKYCEVSKPATASNHTKRQRNNLKDSFGDKNISDSTSGDDDSDSFVETHIVSTKNSFDNRNLSSATLLGKKRSNTSTAHHKAAATTANKKARSLKMCNATRPLTKKRPLQAGLVLEEDIFAASHHTESGIEKAVEDCATVFLQQQHKRIANGERPLLFEDDEFRPQASSIDGIHKKSVVRSNTKKLPPGVSNTTTASKAKNPWIQDDNTSGDPTIDVPKCWCKRPAKLCFKRDGGKAYFACDVTYGSSSNGQNGTIKRCRYFSWAFRSELMPWYRFGQHNQHVLVRSPTTCNSTDTAFSAYDLVQGKVGDCWFLSALAVVAERPDLIQRLFQHQDAASAASVNASVTDWQHRDGQWGMVRVNLFLDGFWTQVVMDNFLPCMLGQINPKEEEELRRAIEESMKPNKEDITLWNDNNGKIRNPYAKRQHAFGDGRRLADGAKIKPTTASDSDPFALSETNLQVMQDTKRFLDKQRFRSINSTSPLDILDRPAESQDLAYSKARRNQLWVPFLEKAYAKVHGSYSAISGGHVAEAFLDLTGAPTLQIQWHQNGANNNSNIMEPRALWDKLLQWRAKRLPMGCGTDSSAEGIIGMHAYSILDIREISNVGVEFFQEQILTGTLGNVSGFTEYDGKVRLLRIRNPHGQGEWKGDFSDKSSKWTDLMLASGVSLPRTMANDGTFWIDYDNFLLGFANIDVVLAFQGNHAKSFSTNFPPKKSNHRCLRAFEVSLIDPQPGIETKDRVEVYVLGIQKSQRGAKQGRSDRKKSYKVSDMGLLVAEYPLDASQDNVDDVQFSLVHGQMFGFRRNGHYRLVLDRNKCTRMVVMPISFGHPAATDHEFSFAVRFNAEYPLMIREIATVPRMDRLLSDFLFQPKPPSFYLETRQGKKMVLWEDSNFKIVQVDCLGNQGGTVFVYLVAKRLGHGQKLNPISFTVEALCRGMSCRTVEGLLEHEIVAKGEKFKAAWRKFASTFSAESRSRLLMVLFQSGQDTEMGSINCSIGTPLGGSEFNKTRHRTTLERYWTTEQPNVLSYEEQGIFHPVKSMDPNRFRLCGQNQDVNAWVDYHAAHQPISEEEDLQKAIELSHQHQVDREFQEAVRRSQQDTDVNNPVKVAEMAEFHDDDDLAVAIALSLQAATSKKVEDAIDLTKYDGQDGNRMSKTGSKEIILLDDSEDDEKKEEAITQVTGGGEASTYMGEKKCAVLSHVLDQKAKRQLAAEAALKRLSEKRNCE
ncbi:calpain family cysteine protease [Nitzschia inconspicua]|uniref:Calpain family cysteine protease n=1 Tax=Nitzschia inconspicua TaxID=303405 RepID=A0A9K3KZD7_9STRA|nr:calpain family cysteine protease [Nitzschia inconspicua]